MELFSCTYILVANVSLRILVIAYTKIGSFWRGMVKKMRKNKLFQHRHVFLMRDNREMLSPPKRLPALINYCQVLFSIICNSPN
jgi:hypothetical protein